MRDGFAGGCSPPGTGGGRDGAVRLLVLGATGRLGRMLRMAWAAAPPAGLEPLWQTRRAPPPGGGWLCWDMLAAPPPGGLRADAVLCLAGVTRGALPADLAQNAGLARAALAAARAAGARHLLLASSAAVYGPGAADAAESCPPAPVSAYGRAKLAAERAAAAAADRPGRGPGPALTCLRIGNVAGADALLGGAAPGRAVVLDRFPGGAGPLRSYIGPGGLARVLAALAWRAGQGAALPRVLNLAAPGAVAMADLLAEAGLAWRWRPAPPGAVARAVLDVSRLAALVAPPAGGAAAIVADWRAAGRPGRGEGG